MLTKEKVKKIIIILIVVYIGILIAGFIGASLLNMIDPPENHSYGDRTDTNDYSSSSSSHSSSSPSSSSSSSHYHGSGYGSSSHSDYDVRDSRYELSRRDPGAYYDHYEYGEDYDIDDYLESEGFD